MWKFQQTEGLRGFLTLVHSHVVSLFQRRCSITAECEVSVVYLCQGSSTTSVRVNEIGFTLFFKSAFRSHLPTIPCFMKKAFLVFCEVFSWILMILGGLAALPLGAYNIWGGIGGVLVFIWGLLIYLQTKKVRKQMASKESPVNIIGGIDTSADSEETPETEAKEIKEVNNNGNRKRQNIGIYIFVGIITLFAILIVLGIIFSGESKTEISKNELIIRNHINKLKTALPKVVVQDPAVIKWIDISYHSNLKTIESIFESDNSDMLEFLMSKSEKDSLYLYLYRYEIFEADDETNRYHKAMLEEGVNERMTFKLRFKDGLILECGHRDFSVELNKRALELSTKEPDKAKRIVINHNLSSYNESLPFNVGGGSFLISIYEGLNPQTGEPTFVLKHHMGSEIDFDYIKENGRDLFLNEVIKLTDLLVFSRAYKMGIGYLFYKHDQKDSVFVGYSYEDLLPYSEDAYQSVHRIY